MAIVWKKAAAAGALCALLLAAPTSAPAQVTITVEIVSGGVVGCGLGVFFYFFASWESHLTGHEPTGALFELADGRTRVGVPIPTLNLVGDPAGDQAPHDAIQVDLLRWRF